MSHLLRIALPDVPGSLGAVATAIGMAGANISAIEIVEQRPDGTAVDDVFVDFTPGVMPDMVISAVQRLDGVRVLWVSRYAVGGGLHLDLEAVEVLTEAPKRAVEQLVEVVPRVFRADWALAARRQEASVRLLACSPAAPALPERAADWFPVRSAQRLELGSQVPSWADTVAAVAPVDDPGTAVVFGRHGGPAVLDSELARLAHLASLAASIQAAARAAPAP